MLSSFWSCLVRYITLTLCSKIWNWKKHESGQIIFCDYPVTVTWTYWEIILDLAKILEILNKGITRKHFKPLSLSLQKEIVQRNICLESQIDRSMDSCRWFFYSDLRKCQLLPGSIEPSSGFIFKTTIELLDQKLYAWWYSFY